MNGLRGNGIAVVLSVLILLLAGTVSGASTELQGSSTPYLYLSADSTGEACIIDPDEEAIIDFQVVLTWNLEGAEGVDFRITGMPENSVLIRKELYPGVLAIGDPVGAGVAMVLPECDPAERIVLGRYWYMLPDTQPFTMAVVASDPPNNPHLNCPLVTLCDAPVYTQRCVDGRSGFVAGRPSEPQPADGTTLHSSAVQLTWSAGQSAFCGLNHWTATYVHLGPESEPPVVYTTVGTYGFEGPFDPGPLLPNTTYYWRITQTSSGTVRSPLWSFKTGSTTPVEGRTWTRVKMIYR